MLYLFLAEGFEEIEALTVVDLLRRAKCEIRTVSVMDSKAVVGGHGITVEADMLFTEANFDNAKMLILPGGLLGVNNLRAHEGLMALLKEKHAAGVTLAAICAAPMILSQLGLLEGQRATIYPDLKEELSGAIYSENMVVKSRNNIFTSRGPATAMYFALALIEELQGEVAAENVKNGLLL